MVDEAAVIAAVERLAESVLHPQAIEVDAHEVPASHLRALSELGALNSGATADSPRAAYSLATQRRISEIIAGACPNTWLVWTQHAALVPALLPLFPDGIPPVLEPVLRPDGVLGVAMSDLRTYPRRHIRVSRAEGGWRFDGKISWFTGYGLATHILLGGVTDDESGPRVVVAVLELDDRFPAEPLALSALTGSRTVTLIVEDVVARDDEVLFIQPYTQWREKDASISDGPQPHVYGLAERVIQELADAPSEQAREAAEAWAERLVELRTDAYENFDAGDPDGRARSLKVLAHETLAVLSAALVSARGGRGLLSADTAQLYARTALFFRVQGLSAPVRAAQLESARDTALGRGFLADALRV